MGKGCITLLFLLPPPSPLGALEYWCVWGRPPSLGPLGFHCPCSVGATSLPSPSTLLCSSALLPSRLAAASLPLQPLVSSVNTPDPLIIPLGLQSLWPPLSVLPVKPCSHIFSPWGFSFPLAPTPLPLVEPCSHTPLPLGPRPLSTPPFPWAPVPLALTLCPWPLCRTPSCPWPFAGPWPHLIPSGPTSCLRPHPFCPRPMCRTPSCPGLTPLAPPLLPPAPVPLASPHL